jgi:uncharacterized membrane protein YkoI
MRWTCLAHSRSIQRPAGIDRRMKGMMLSAALAFVALLGLASPAQAQWSDSFTAGEARTARDKGDVVPLRDIFRQLRRRYGGYQIDANLYNRGSRQVYVIDWMTGKGERLRVTVDARTGRIQS